MTVVYNTDLLQLSSSVESSDDDEFSDEKSNHYHLPPVGLVDSEKGELPITTLATSPSTSSIAKNSTTAHPNSSNSNINQRAAPPTSPMHSRDSSISSLSNFSKKLTINTKSSLPESINKLSNKFKRNNSISSNNLNIFTRKPSISMKSSDSPNSSLHSNSIDDFFDFENINISGSGTLKRINSWSNHLHKNSSVNSNLAGSANLVTPVAGVGSPSASNMFQMKSTSKGIFLTNEIENLKFRNRANSSPQQTIVSRKSSISIQNLNLIKKKNNTNNNSNHSFDQVEKSANTSLHATNDISDDYFSKHRVDSSHEFYLDNLETFDLDLENDKFAVHDGSNNISTNSTSINLNSVNPGTVVTSPLTLNSYKFSTPELRCEEFDTSIITINSTSTTENNLSSSNPHPHQHPHPHPHHHHHHHPHGKEHRFAAEDTAVPDSPNPATLHSNAIKSFPGWSLKDGLLVPNEDSG